MGVTYKALDVDLRCPVTLKVISERYLGDESAQLRFLREARAAASVRHPNVASVFHLGRTGSSYFYAMEFVEGETLENFISRLRRVKVTVALEIMTQVAAGLAAVHEQNLVHRDIKPSNILVRLKDDRLITAKIIDLGLAKAVNEPSGQTAISTPGAFAGTPEFASPEQFAGVPIDIRSDLYSLGMTLWEMLTGKTPFRGTPGEVMYQHQHTPLPLEELKGVPQPLVVLLETLLEKDPGRRFQNPGELLKAIPTITERIEAGRRITRYGLHKMPPAAAPPGLVGHRQNRVRRRFQSLDYPSQEVICLVGRRISFFWTMRGQTRMPTSLPSLPGLESESPRSSIIGSAEWLLNSIALHNSFLVGLSTDRAPAGTLRQPMNFLMQLSPGLEIPMQGSELPGRRGRGSRNSSHIVEPYWFWTAWSRSKIHLDRKKDGCVSLRSRRSCANSLPSIRVFA
jgi:serine/threonine protein kinase